MSEKTEKRNSGSKPKATTDKPRKYFLHWYTNDFQRVAMVLVGDVKAAAPELRRAWEKRTAADKVIAAFEDISGGFDYANLVANKSGVATKLDGGGVSVAWFPVIPTDPVLVHELTHCVQFMCEDLNIDDWEYQANMLEALFGFFRDKLREDSALPFSPPDGAKIEK